MLERQSDTNTPCNQYIELTKQAKGSTDQTQAVLRLSGQFLYKHLSTKAGAAIRMVAGQFEESCSEQTLESKARNGDSDFFQRKP